MMKYSKVICVLFIIAISLSLVSSQTLIAGKVYNGDFSDTLDGVDVSVACNSYSLNTNTFGDGTYAVRFEENECNGNDSVSVSVSKSGFEGKTGSGVVSKCDDVDCDENYVLIVNLGMKTESAETGSTGSSGSSGGRYYFCGNGKCDSGESSITCPRDCKVVVKQTTETTKNEETTNTEGATEMPEEITEVIEEPQQEEPKIRLFSGMTGAVIGTLGTAGVLIAVIFLVGLIVVAITVKIVRGRKSYESFY